MPQLSQPRQQLIRRQEVDKFYHDRRVRDLPPLHTNDAVRVRDEGEWIRARVLQPNVAPRSHVIETEYGSVLRRNRRDIIKTKEDPPVCAPPIDDSSSSTTKDTVAPTPSIMPTVTPPSRPMTPAPPVAKLPSILRTTSSGRAVKPPVRFADFDMTNYHR
jgi:hypothetical protein